MPASVQPLISRNVRILMAFKLVRQSEIAEVIGKTAGAVGHKLAGRSKWTLDDVARLSQYGGPKWPVDRFVVDPDRWDAPV